jgi:proline iminopeptidase
MLRLPTSALSVCLLLLISAAAQPAATSEGLKPINGTELWVKRIGAGDPIVVVHGGPVLDHGYLLPHLEPLAEDYELVFYDQRLSGRSSPAVGEDELSIGAFVEDIEALRSKLDLGKIHLMAHSWGGHLALRYALDHGEHLASLVLLDSMAASTELWREEEKLLGESVSAEIAAERNAILESEALKAREPGAIEKLMKVSFSSQFHDPAKAAALEFYIPEDYAARSQRFAALAPELEAYDLHEPLAALTVPTLVLYGEAEPGAALGGKAIADAIPGAELVLIPEAGHFPFVEQPYAFASEVRSFLGRHAIAGGEGAGDDSGLFAHLWKLTHLDGQAVEEGAAMRPAEIQFDREQMRASGSDGCNRFFGPFELDGDSISFGMMASTKMACPGGGDAERRFHAALEASESLRLEGERLELLGAEGEALMRFAAAPLESD